MESSLWTLPFLMIEFGLKHGHKRRSKVKFPRHLFRNTDFKHSRMRDHLQRDWWDSYGYLSYKDIDKFIESHLGENVDKVFSEYVKRAKRFDHNVNLRDRFYEELRGNRWRNEYTIDSQKRIVRNKENKNKDISIREAADYNKAHLPESFKFYMKDNELTYVGHFYIKKNGFYGKWILSPVFITNKDWYDTVLSIGFGKEYIKYSNMSKISISLPQQSSPFNWTRTDNAVGVPKRGYATIFEKTGRSVELLNGYLWDIERPVNVPYTCDLLEADFIFLTKGTDYK